MSVQRHTKSVDAALAERLYRQAKADRWGLPQAAFTAALETSCAKAFSAVDAAPRDLSRYLGSLHLEDLALACACALGNAAAWDHFVLEMRPGLYRAADALDPTGAARELADSLYADLYGVDQRGGARQSLLRYFHGRSSLATWLRAVLAQRHVDRVRAGRRTEPLPEELPVVASSAPADPECGHFLETLRPALERALADLAPRDRLRLRLYYAQQLTLAADGQAAEGARGDHVAAACAHATGDTRRGRTGPPLARIERRADRAMFRVRDGRCRRHEPGRDVEYIAQGTAIGSFYMKREPVNGERDENGWLANTLRHSTAAGEGCLDAETLAAWADGGLSAQAAAAVELHASTCSRCTAMLAAIERTAPAAPVRHAWTPRAPLSLARTLDGCRHGGCDLGRRSGSTGHTGSVASRARSPVTERTD